MIERLKAQIEIRGIKNQDMLKTKEFADTKYVNAMDQFIQNKVTYESVDHVLTTNLCNIDKESYEHSQNYNNNQTYLENLYQQARKTGVQFHPESFLEENMQSEKSKLIENVKTLSAKSLWLRFVFNQKRYKILCLFGSISPSKRQLCYNETTARTMQQF